MTLLNIPIVINTDGPRQLCTCPKWMKQWLRWYHNTESITNNNRYDKILVESVVFNIISNNIIKSALYTRTLFEIWVFVFKMTKQFICIFMMINKTRPIELPAKTETKPFTYDRFLLLHLYYRHTCTWCVNLQWIAYRHCVQTRQDSSKPRKRLWKKC